MPYWELKKYFRGGSDTYYIKLRKGEALTQMMLESIGEHTTGGHENGFSIKAKKIKRLPKGAELLKRSYKTTVCVY